MIKAILPLSDKALEALSYVIVTATEGGHYTRDDFKKWTTYKHGETEKGFRAEVTVYPNDEGIEGVSLDPVRLTPEEFGERLVNRFSMTKLPSHHAVMILRLLAGDEDIAGEMDVVDSGAIMQVAVYGETIYG